MRISGWLVGVVSFVVLILGTSLCSIVTYSSVRQGVIDLQSSGILLESPGQMVAALTGNLEPTPVPLVESGPVEMQPIFTPAPTMAVDELADPASAAPAEATAEPVPAEATPELSEDELLASQYSWDDPRQIRILLMGIDQRSEGGEPGPFRTDTMILINVDPVRKTAGVLSLPRDLWVSIPNFPQPGRINTANFIGDTNAYPGGGGPALAMETVAANFGIRVDKYVLINFDVFEAVVDTLAPGGIEVCVREVIDDPDYPDAGFGYIAVRFDPGCQAMDSERLLQYARTRATEGGDFDRARRQQEVLDAVRAEVLSAGGIRNFITQIGTLWDELSGSYKTNLTPDEIIRLGFLMNEIDRENIRYAVIDTNYVDLGTAADGQRILVPLQSRINDLVQRVFYGQREVSSADLRARFEEEAAPVYVYNGTEIAGLANATREWLTGRGVLVSGTGNDMNHVGSDTVIRDYGGHPDTARYLANLLGISVDRIEPGIDGLRADGVMVVIGPDIQAIISSE